MVAQAPPAAAGSAATGVSGVAGAHASPQEKRTVGNAQRLVDHVRRAAVLQWQIFVLRCKLQAQRLGIIAALAAVAAVVAVLGVIFTYIFVFHALRLVLSAFWVWLIFAGAHLLLAAGCVLAIRATLEKFKRNSV